MNKHNVPIARMLDCHVTKRWTLCATSVESTVASHSFNVAAIAMAIAREMMTTFGITEQEICYWAMMHDVEETITGDIPSPFKAKLKDAGVDIEGLAETKGEVPDAPSLVAEIVKIADLIESVIFIQRYGVGTRARSGWEETRRRADEAIAGASLPDLARAATVVWVDINAH